MARHVKGKIDLDQSLDLIGIRLGNRYEVKEHFAFGSNAEIFLARDLRATNESEQWVIVKTFNPHLDGKYDTGLEQQLAELFDREATALKELSCPGHPNIVKFYCNGHARDRRGEKFRYLVIEYLAGGDLHELVLGSDPARSINQSLEIIRQLSDALTYAHARSKKIIHRDLKPDNVAFSKDGKTAKIIDYNAVRMDELGSHITRIGTKEYSAPEHAPGLDTPNSETTKLTPAADVYSLAKVAYFMLTRKVPREFSQKPLSSWPEDFDQPVWAKAVLQVLKRATHNSPSARYQSAAGFRDALHNAVLGAINEKDDNEETIVRAPRRAVFHQRSMIQNVFASVMLLFTAALLMVLVLSLRTGPGQSSPRSSPVGKIGTMKIDAGLRAGETAESRSVGWVWKESRVRIRAASGDWLFVEVIRYSKPKKKPESVDCGWMKRASVTINSSGH